MPRALIVGNIFWINCTLLNELFHEWLGEKEIDWADDASVADRIRQYHSVNILSALKSLVPKVKTKIKTRGRFYYPIHIVHWISHDRKLPTAIQGLFPLIDINYLHHRFQLKKNLPFSEILTTKIQNPFQNEYQQKD